MSLTAIAFMLALGLPPGQSPAAHSASTVPANPSSAAKTVPAKNPVPVSSAAKTKQNVIPLAFKEFLEVSSGALKPTAKLLACDNKRVRIVGFMAQMEDPIQGGFYLCPRPVFCDEGGGGTGDLPPESVFVIVRSAKGKVLAHKPQPLEAVGILHIGAQTDEDGHVSMIRLILDRPNDAPPKAVPAKQKPARSAVKSKTRSTHK